MRLCIVSVLVVFGITSSWAQETLGRDVRSFLSFANATAWGAIRQNQFRLDVAHGKIDCVEVWIVPSKNLLIVKGGILEADKIESLQKGINLTEVNLIDKLAVLDGRLFAAQPLRGGWGEVEMQPLFLGYGNDLQLDISSFSDYALKIAFWRKALDNSPKDSNSRLDAEKNLRSLTPNDGIVDYTDGSSGVRLWLNKDSMISRAQTLQDGIVFYEIQNTFLKEIPSNVLAVLSELNQVGTGIAPNKFMDALKGKKALGMFFAPSPDSLQEVVWVAPTGPAAKAGLKEGDLILKINGIEVKKLTADKIKDLLTRDDSFTFSVRRDDAEFELQNVAKSIFNP